MQFAVVLILTVPFLIAARFSSYIFGTEEKPLAMAFRDTVPALLFSCIFIAPYFGGASDLPYYFSAASVTFVLAWLFYRGQTETRPAMSMSAIYDFVVQIFVWSGILAFFAAVGGGFYYAYHWLRYGKSVDSTLLSMFGPIKTGWLGLDKIILNLLELQWPIGALILCGCITLLGFWFDDQKSTVKPAE